MEEFMTEGMFSFLLTNFYKSVFEEILKLLEEKEYETIKKMSEVIVETLGECIDEM